MSDKNKKTIVRRNLNQPLAPSVTDRQRNKMTGGTKTKKKAVTDPYTQHNVSGGNQQARINKAKALNMNLKVYKAKAGDKVKLKGTHKRLLKSSYRFPALKLKK